MVVHSYAPEPIAPGRNRTALTLMRLALGEDPSSATAFQRVRSLRGTTPSFHNGDRPVDGSIVDGARCKGGQFRPDRRYVGLARCGHGMPT